MSMLREGSGPLEASILVEALRAIPAAFLATGLVFHALIWAIATHFAEPSPSPQMAIALAFGREWLPGYDGLPPLAAWSSELIYQWTGSLFAVRLAAAFCVALSGWILFLFARRIIGERQGAIAVLLMVSVFPVAFPGSALTGELLQMPLAAAAILCWWMAVGERNPNAWMPLGAVLGAMFYAGPQALALLAVFVLLTLLSARGRAGIFRLEALASLAVGLLIFLFVAAPRFFWIWQHGWSDLFPGPGSGISAGEALTPLRLLFSILAGHFGFALLAFLATAYLARAKENAPVFVREPVGLFAYRGVLVLAVLPAAFALLSLYLLDRSVRPQFMVPLLMLGGMAAIVMGGERLILRRQMLIGVIALIYVFVPPAMLLFSSFTPGWLNENRAANWPAESAARTFTNIYHTRTGRPLEYMIGARVPAAQIAALSEDRPHILIDGDAKLTPWIDPEAVKKKGGIVFWEIRGPNSAPPAEYVARLPAFTEEAPLRLPWARGGGDPVRLGWAIVPPQQ